jgi:antitoxin ParD1/3/4
MLMSTSTMHISLSDALKQRVKERVEQEHFSNPSDYVRTLIREDLKRQDEKRLEEMLLEGLASGSRTLGPQEWKELKEKILAGAGRQDSAL